MAGVQNTRIPDALILIYPALYMRSVPSPSRLLSIIDPLLPSAILKECFAAYYPRQANITSPTDTPFLSPASASDEMLLKMPQKTYILAGTWDPLMDDSVHFAKRLANLGHNVKLKLMDGFPHGFLNLAMIPGLGKEMRRGVKIVSDWMKEVFQS